MEKPTLPTTAISRCVSPRSSLASRSSFCWYEDDEQLVRKSLVMLHNDGFSFWCEDTVWTEIAKHLERKSTSPVASSKSDLILFSDLQLVRCPVSDLDTCDGTMHMDGASGVIFDVAHIMDNKSKSGIYEGKSAVTEYKGINSGFGLAFNEVVRERIKSNEVLRERIKRYATSSRVQFLRNKRYATLQLKQASASSSPLSFFPEMNLNTVTRLVILEEGNLVGYRVIDPATLVEDFRPELQFPLSEPVATNLDGWVLRRGVGEEGAHTYSYVNIRHPELIVHLPSTELQIAALPDIPLFPAAPRGPTFGATFSGTPGLDGVTCLCFMLEGHIYVQHNAAGDNFWWTLRLANQNLVNDEDEEVAACLVRDHSLHILTNHHLFVCASLTNGYMWNYTFDMVLDDAEMVHYLLCVDNGSVVVVRKMDSHLIPLLHRVDIHQEILQPITHLTRTLLVSVLYGGCTVAAASPNDLGKIFIAGTNWVDSHAVEVKGPPHWMDKVIMPCEENPCEHKCSWMRYFDFQ